MLFKRVSPRRLPLLLLGGVAAIVLVWAWPSSAGAATAPPESSGSCYGSLTPAPTGDEPDLLSYKFRCDRRTVAYTVLVNRGTDDATIDDFSTTASVFGPDGTTPNATLSWSCEGFVPGTSVNCHTGGFSSFMGAWSYAEGTIDPTGPYCKNLPVGAKPRTPAQPGALVQLVVTDTAGAQDGPFRLFYTGKCPRVPDRVPAAKHRRKK